MSDAFGIKTAEKAIELNKKEAEFYLEGLKLTTEEMRSDCEKFLKGDGKDAAQMIRLFMMYMDATLKTIRNLETYLGVLEAYLSEFEKLFKDVQKKAEKLLEGQKESKSLKKSPTFIY